MAPCPVTSPGMNGSRLDAARWARADDLFDRALDLPPACWRAWLDLEEPDQEIRDRVLRLLWQDAQSESQRRHIALPGTPPPFLDPPGSAAD